MPHSGKLEIRLEMLRICGLVILKVKKGKSLKKIKKENMGTLFTNNDSYALRILKVLKES